MHILFARRVVLSIKYTDRYLMNSRMLLSLKYFYAAISIQLFVSAARVHQNDSELRQWNSYKIQFNKTYESPYEDQSRMEIYFNNVAKIFEHNERFKKNEVPYEVEMNQFGDWFPREFGELPTTLEEALIRDNDPRANISLPFSDRNVPQTKNWVSEGAVSAVKDQGKCGSCWAFATAGVLESYFFILNKGQTPVESLSPQDLVDCVSSMGEDYEDSCEGGYIQDALDFVKKYGIATDKSYPYLDEKSRCKHDPINFGRKIKTYQVIDPNDVNRLKEVVGLIGPVISSLDSSDFGFRFYKRGLYNSETCSKSNLDHSLAIVGYGTDENGKDYWLVKNSRGVTWGEKGFAKVARNYNVCGIETDNIYPEL